LPRCARSASSRHVAAAAGTAHDAAAAAAAAAALARVSVNEDATLKDVASLIVNNFSNYTGSFARVYSPDTCTVLKLTRT
jgi:hypothetical protein